MREEGKSGSGRLFKAFVLLAISSLWIASLVIISFTRAITLPTKARLHEDLESGDELKRHVPTQTSRDYLSIFFHRPDGFDKLYGHFPESLRLETLKEARAMFEFGYDNYMKYAFPMDELNPIDCVGRGPDMENPYVLVLITMSTKPALFRR